MTSHWKFSPLVGGAERLADRLGFAVEEGAGLGMGVFVRDQGSEEEELASWIITIK